MKKLFATFLLTLLLITAFCFIVNAHGNTVKTAEKLTLNTKSEVTLDGHQDGLWTYYFLFIPSETTTYDLSLKSSYEISADIYDDKGNLVDIMEYNEFAEKALCTVQLKAKCKYYIKIEEWLFDEVVQITANVSKHSHTYKTYIYKAEIGYSGYINKYCSVCDYEKKTTIPAIKTVKLSATSFAYDGKTKKPVLTVKDSKGKDLKKDADYTVSGTLSAKNIGTYSIKVKFKGNYKDSKTLTYKITLAKPTGLKATQTTTSITLTWNKVEKATSYTVYNEFTNKKLTVKTNSATFKNLYPCSKYSFYVVATTKIDEKTYKSPYSATLNTATKPEKPSDFEIYARKNSASLNWHNEDCMDYQIYMATSKDGEYKKVKTIHLTYIGSQSTTVKDLKASKTYYFKVRGFVKNGSSTVYSSFSSIKSVKVK